MRRHPRLSLAPGKPPRGLLCGLLALVLVGCGGKEPERMENLPRHEQRVDAARRIMADFASRTGLTSDAREQRYLWTDAFAVCNFLGLARATGDDAQLKLALHLVDRVHHVLGRHREDDPRTGWLSGLDEAGAKEHPTLGGLRIGKPLRERPVDEPLDQGLEWDRDGQYFHYLTRWMHALDLVTRHTGEPRFNLWARELAETARRAFVYKPPGAGGPRMYWKMSVDLTRPLVPSMGHHDPLDGYVTCLQLHATAASLRPPAAGPALAGEMRAFDAMVQGRDWTTSDPLGLGGLLLDAFRLDQLQVQGAIDASDLVKDLLGAALEGLRQYVREGELDRPASVRLAFRELGLATGLRAVERMVRDADGPPGKLRHDDVTRRRLEDLAAFIPLAGRIVLFWLAPENRRADTWTEHLNINEVMLATALVPGGCLRLPAVETDSLH